MNKYLILALFLTACGHDGSAGRNGSNGTSGVQGLPGLDASPCTVEQLEDGVRFVCGDTSAVLLDGKDGQNSSCSEEDEGESSSHSNNGNHYGQNKGDK